MQQVALKRLKTVRRGQVAGSGGGRLLADAAGFVPRISLRKVRVLSIVFPTTRQRNYQAVSSGAKVPAGPREFYAQARGLSSRLVEVKFSTQCHQI
jgi:hypothetical protein